MKGSIIDLGVIDNDKENPIDEIMSIVERYSLTSQDYRLRETIEKKNFAFGKNYARFIR